MVQDGGARLEDGVRRVFEVVHDPVRHGERSVLAVGLDEAYDDVVAAPFVVGAQEASHAARSVVVVDCQASRHRTPSTKRAATLLEPQKGVVFAGREVVRAGDMGPVSVA